LVKKLKRIIMENKHLISILDLSLDEILEIFNTIPILLIVKIKLIPP